jgi:hypothetical protein
MYKLQEAKINFLDYFKLIINDFQNAVMHVNSQPKIYQTVIWIADANFTGDIVFT